MSEKFECRYEVDDGYCWKSKPQYFNINKLEIKDYMNEQDLRDLFQGKMQYAFERSIFPYEKNQEEFVEWALEIIKQNKDI